MNEKNDLLELLKNYIIHIRINYEKKNPLQLNEELCLFLKDKVDTISNNYGEIVNLDIDKIRELFPFYNEIDLHNLRYYQFILRDTKFELQGEDYKVLKNVFKNLFSNIDLYMDKINTFKSNRENEIKKKVEPFQIIIDKISNDIKLTSEDIELIYNIIKLSRKNINDSIKIMRYLFNESMKNNVVSNDELLSDNNDADDELEIVEFTNLSYEQLFNLFSKYGLNFDLFNDEEKSELQNYGNLSNIEDILNAFSKYNVNLSDYLSSRSSALKNIFLYSNAVIVSSLIDNFIKYGVINKDKGKLDVSLLLEKPSRFFNRKKKWAKRKPGNGGIDQFDGVAGCYEDVIKNLEYFSKEGLDVSAAYIKSGCYFDIPHNKILEVVKIFNLYDIEKKYYFRTLSCFASKHQADVIDLFLELGYFDYLKNNMSRILQTPNSPIFYKLARANQLGKTPRMRGKVMDGDITYDNREYLGIDKSNGRDVTKQYVFEFDGKEYYDEILNSNESNRYNVLDVVQRDLISLLDGEYIQIEDNGFPNHSLYNINGILLSRVKFLRVLNTLIVNGVTPSLNAIMYSLTRNSIITKEQFNIVYDSVRSIYEKVSTKKGGRNK